MIKLKRPEEVALMIEGGTRLKQAYKQLKQTIKVGMSTEQIDKIAEKLIIKAGGQSSFKRVENYHWTTCLPINEQIVHTPPSKRTLKNGDVLTIDIGMFYKGFHTDFSDTFVIGQSHPKTNLFLEVGKQTLAKAIETVKVGKRIGNISQVIEQEINKAGYFVIKDLTGHGIGRDLHEDPYIFGFVDRLIQKTDLIKPGMTLAIEIIYSQGTEKMKFEKSDEWSIITADRSLSACFEHTIAVTDKKALILT